MIVPRRLLLLISAAVWMAGCSRGPQWSSLPIQRPAEAMSPVDRWRPAFIDMADPQASNYIVSGTREFTEGDGWRWTYARPEFRFPLTRADGWRFRIDFDLPEPNFKTTGPVTVSIAINGHPLQSLRYVTPGRHFIEEPVPAEWLRPSQETSAAWDVRVAVQIEPPWPDPSGREKLGVVLKRVGFVR